MLQKIKNFIKNPSWHNFQDVRFLGFMGFAVIVLLTSWSGVNVIQTNYVLQQQIATLEQQNHVQQLTNDNLKLQNQYYNSQTYLELTARQQFSKGLPGEKLITVSKDVALAHAPALPDNATQSTTPKDDRPTYQKNFSAWIDFFLHHSS